MKYLYCVIPAGREQTFEVRGISAPGSGPGGQVYTIPYEDLSLVASDCEPFPWASISKEELFNYLLLHQGAIEKIMQNCSVIPLKFGTFIGGGQETQKMMKRGYPLFKASLQATAGRIELNLVALWANLNEVLKEIGERPEIQRLKEEVVQRPLPERVPGGIELGKMVKYLLDKKRDEIAEEMAAGLRETVFNRNAVLNDNMIANLAFLIDKSKTKEFELALGELDKKYAGQINFKLVGPLPPYSFATFEVKKLTPEEIFYAKAVLGIVEDPCPEEVKQSYYALAGKLHPDKNRDNPEAARQFDELKRAYDLLSEFSSHGRDLWQVRKLTWDQLNNKF